MTLILKTGQKCIEGINFSKRYYINSGYESVVYKSNCGKYALKVFKEGKTRNYVNEKYAIETLKECKNIIKAHSFCQVEDLRLNGFYNGIVYPYYKFGDGHDYIENMKNIRIKNRCKYVERRFKTMWNAINECHQHDICHRDIKPENFMVEKIGRNQTVILSDFGLSTNTKKYKNARAGTYTFMAPEIFAKNFHYYNHKVDIWSGGITWLNIIAYHYDINYHLIKKYGYKEIRDNNPNIWKRMTKKTQFILENTLQINYEDRLDANKIVELF